GLGAGLPVGGILFNKSCSHALEPGDHGTTFGGNPVVCAGGIEVLKRIDQEFLEQVVKKGNLLKAQIEKMDGVLQVTGLGMMLGISVKDKNAKEVVKSALGLGLIILTAKDRIRLLPPLNITYDEINEGLELLQKALK
ncbi:MAG TPA: aminotransferase class III-fold pyridoxal phosphate-dependent enzyme, partial [Anaerovoracaceae bacterium]|nr:aminotransferase class III-fold pyridoxal phosphate-dependent enzyme [Anaerovoracaceae bacterium]